MKYNRWNRGNINNRTVVVYFCITTARDNNKSEKDYLVAYVIANVKNVQTETTTTSLNRLGSLEIPSNATRVKSPGRDFEKTQPEFQFVANSAERVSSQRNYRYHRPPFDRITRFEKFRQQISQNRVFFPSSYAKTTIVAFFYFFFNESSEFGILERKEEGKKEPGGCSSLFPLPTLTTIMKQGLCKSAIWKSTWPVTRKASLYPTDKCDDCLTPRKVPKARAISKNNRVYRLLLLLPRATGNHEIKGTRPSYNVARLYLPFMERSKGWGISRSYSDFIRLRARLLDQDIPEEIPLKDIQSGNQRRINIEANLFIEKNSYACPKYEEICWLFFLRTNLEPSRITTKNRWYG